MAGLCLPGGAEAGIDDAGAGVSATWEECLRRSSTNALVLKGFENEHERDRVVDIC